MAWSQADVWTTCLSAFLMCGCGGDEVEPGSTPEDECTPPDRLTDDGRCIEPGVQNDGCPAGTLGLDDGSCQPAGIPTEMCADGFEPAGQGCEPILPPEPCPKGLMALPGETICRSVMPCGSGKWGDLPVDASTEHVDASYAGGDSDGSAAKPWTTIGEALATAEPDVLIAIAEGSYAEDVVVSGKRVKLWGVCPEKVEVLGTGAELAAVVILASADGTEVGGL
ncbi:MAG: hypothetical protein JRI68_21215, partial [Deltaproteobacteria bacterium]|nr:hypothetical protein [Deltaproteobacteria bacterium]